MRALLLATLALTAPLSAEEPSRADTRAAKLTAEKVAELVEAKGGDALDPVLKLSTERVSFRKIGGDQFLRAYVDRAKGEVFYQVYLILESPESFRPARLNYLVGGELQIANLDRVDFDVSCYNAYRCTHIEHAVADIPAEHMRALAACPAGELFFRVRVFGDFVDGRDIVLPCSEAAGLMLAVEKRISG